MPARKLAPQIEAQQNECLASERYEDAREYQKTIDNVLESRDSGAGLTTTLPFQALSGGKGCRALLHPERYRALLKPG